MALIMQTSAHLTNIKNLSLFNNTINDSKVLVKFTASWCSPCRASRPTIEALSNNDAYKDIKFIEVDIDHGSKIATKYGIRGIPAFVFFNKGTVVKKIVGFDSNTASALKKQLETMLEK